MKYRLAEGSGECFYYLGVEDDGYPRGLEPQDLQVSVSTLNIMAGQVCVVWGGVDGVERWISLVPHPQICNNIVFAPQLVHTFSWAPRWSLCGTFPGPGAGGERDLF